MDPIDLRSDTLTHPTEAMREAMATAEVGDDVFNEDPTVNQLQDLSAEKMGKEAALFVPSGTMGNLISVLSQCQRGDEVILGDQSHLFLNEVGGIAALGGVHPRTVPNAPDGTLPLETVEQAVRGSDVHYPTTRMIGLENTHNYCQGSPLTPDYMDQVTRLASQYGLKIHLDGARIFNAAVALNVDVRELVTQVDSMTFCLSKGLSAPVGSVICGSRQFIDRARKLRKMVGGGMRQAGHLAAAGLVALDSMVDRLREDHANAYKLARGLAELEGIDLNVDAVKTNIVFFEFNHPGMSPGQFLDAMNEEGIKLLMMSPRTFRAVLHREISAHQVDTVLESTRFLLQPKVGKAE